MHAVLQYTDLCTGTSNSVYLYEFSQRGEFDTAPAWIRADPSIPFSAEDRALSVKMMAYWTNFTKNG